VANLLRSLSARSVRCRLTLSLATTALVVLAAGAVPAGAVLVPGSFGEQQRTKATVAVSPLEYHGGPVLHSSVSYAVYWDPSGSYNNEWQQLIDGYLQGVGAEKGTLKDVFALNGQYRDGGGRAANEAIFRGAYTDEDPYPTSGNCTEPATLSCLTDAQIRTELLHLIESGKLPGATGTLASYTPVYYILTPPGVTVCTDTGGTGNCSNSTASPANGLCGYHSAINPATPNPTVYAVQPWVAGNAGQVISSKEPTVTRTPTADVLACQNNRELVEPNQLASHNVFGEWTEGLADVIISDLSVEQSNVVTNPLLNGWYQESTKAEQGDMCQWGFGPPPVPLPKVSEEQQPAHAETYGNETIGGHAYYLQYGFDSVGLTAGKPPTCWSGVGLEPHFTAPNPVNSGDVVAFDATESLITLNAHTVGLPANEPYAPVVYAWSFGDGTTASGSNAASQFHSYQYGGSYGVTLTVTDSAGNTNSFAKPITVVGPSAPSAGSSTGAAGAGTAAGASGSSGSTKAAPKPVATLAAVSRSLRRVLKRGLVIRYSVSEQVAGHFEVMLATSIAHRLGLRGAAATGLAKGTPAQTIIGKAILVTTQGGRSAVDIQLGKKTASLLGKLHKVSLMLRLALRNAQNQTVTVLSTVTLSG
jgi:hypothetical protein